MTKMQAMETDLRKDNIEVLYRNHQWMVQNDNGTIFVIEVLSDYPDDLEGGYWIRGTDLEFPLSPDDSWVTHVCGKTWVDPQAFRGALDYAAEHCGIKLAFSLDEEFERARQMKEEPVPDIIVNVLKSLKTA
jgi:hypothetical protein